MEQFLVVTMQWFDQSNYEASTIRCSALSVEVLKVGREFKQKSINDLDLVLFV